MSLTGVRICVTGTLSRSRKELEGIVLGQGGDWAKTCSAKTTVVVATEAEVRNATTKIGQARKHCKPIVSEVSHRVPLPLTPLTPVSLFALSHRRRHSRNCSVAAPRSLALSLAFSLWTVLTASHCPHRRPGSTPPWPRVPLWPTCRHTSSTVAAAAAAR